MQTREIETKDLKIDNPDFLSPFTYETMTDPVIDPSGMSGNREEMDAWARNQGSAILNPSIRYTPEDLITNFALKCCIDEHPQYCSGTLLQYYQNEAEKLISILDNYLVRLAGNHELSKFQLSWPFAAICPLSLEFITDPVITPSGITYQKSAIVDWLKTHTFDPFTRQPLAKKNLVNNNNLREPLRHYITKLQNDISLKQRCIMIKDRLTQIRDSAALIHQLRKKQHNRKTLLTGTLLAAGLGYMGLLIKHIMQEYDAEQVVHPPEFQDQSPVHWFGHDVLKPLVSAGYGFVLMSLQSLSDHRNQELNAATKQCSKDQFKCHNLLHLLFKHERIDLLKRLFESVNASVLTAVINNERTSGNIKIIYLLDKLDPQLLLKHPRFLPHAAKLGDMKAVEFLLKKGIPVYTEYSNSDLTTALFHAVNEGNLPMLKLLLANGADNGELAVYLKIAAEKNHVVIIKYVLKKFPHLCRELADKKTLLNLIKAGQKEMLQLLQDAGIDLALLKEQTGEDNEMLLQAIQCAENSFRCLKSVFEKDTVSREDRLAIIKLILQSKPNLKEIILNSRILNSCSSSNEDIVIDIVKILIDAGAPVDTVKSDGDFHYTALSLAMRHGGYCKDLTQLLVNHTTENLYPILEYAIRDMNYSMIPSLLIESIKIILTKVSSQDHFEQYLDNNKFNERLAWWHLTDTIWGNKEHRGTPIFASLFAHLFNVGITLSDIPDHSNISEEFLNQVLITLPKLEKSHRREKGLSGVLLYAAKKGYFSIVKQIAPLFSVDSDIFSKSLDIANERKQHQVYNFLRHFKLNMKGQVAVVKTKYSCTTFKAKEQFVSKNSFDILADGGMLKKDRVLP